MDSTVEELRRVSHHMMPEELLRSGLVSALRDFAVRVPGAHFQTVGNVRLKTDVELVLYRCAYELVNNAMKHAKAEHIEIQLMQETRQVTLTVCDDGTGMGETAQCMGLQNIRERIAPYQGRLDIVSADSRGTDINITLPL